MFALALTRLTCMGGGATLQAGIENALPAKEIRPGAVLLRHTAERAERVSGFYVRLANCLGPEEKPVVAALRTGAALRPERVAIPVFPFPLVKYTKANDHVYPPLDVGQEYRVALSPPLELNAGAVVTVEVASCGQMDSGVVAGLQFQGVWPLAEMRQPFRAARSCGPVSRVDWSAREVVCIGNQIKFDPECAPQNNSGIAADADGTLYQFSAYYSVDEQYGGGRGGSYSRIFGFRKAPGATEWEKMGLLVDPVPAGLTYAGDPFIFRDLDGTPCLAYSTADGTDGFSDWKLIDGRVLRSRTKSFAGPWGEPHALYEKFPRHGGGRHEGRMIGIRIYPRVETKDYVLLWQHGSPDIHVRGVIIPDLNAKLTHEQIQQAAVLARNQEEGGGGFQRDGKGYLSTWQIPCINDTTALQRLYEFDLADPLNPEKWRVVPGSWGFNDGTHPVEDGGCTADSWSLSMVGDDLWATVVTWSVSNHKNAVLACRVPWEKRLGDSFRYGVTKVASYRDVVPVVEYAVGDACSLSLDFTGQGKEAYAFLLLGPASQSLWRGTVGLEVSDKGTRLVAYSADLKPAGLTPYQEPRWAEGKTLKLKLQREGMRIAAWANGVQCGPVTLTDESRIRFLSEPQRFKLYGWQGGLYTIKHAVLTDGPEL